MVVVLVVEDLLRDFCGEITKIYFFVYCTTFSTTARTALPKPPLENRQNARNRHKMSRITLLFPFLVYCAALRCDPVLLHSPGSGR